MSVTRRAALASLATLSQAGPSSARKLPPDTPAAVAAILDRSLRQDPSVWNTDWFGTLLMKGMLEWGGSHVPEVREYARHWLDHHLSRTSVSKYSGAKSRAVTAGGVPITTYAGHYGLALPCYEIYRQLRDERARRVAIDVASIILHRSARNHLGLVGHDDHAEFAIPDTCYFVASAVMIASRLDARNETAFREQAIFQLRAYTDTFLVKETGLAKTILFNKTGLGNTYWTRASGWLLWAMTGVLRHLPASDAARRPFLEDMRRLAEGIVRVQDPGGGFRVLLNEPDAPLETTGSAMFASGLHEAVRSGWLPGSFKEPAMRAWQYVQKNLTRDGDIRQAYTGWAVPAEKREMSMDKHVMGWIPGFILSTAYEMSLG
ncbi:MAG: glycoside hydrolase family 88 protein [Bryobacterales bacterium]|nr:glycoside hydrolase family 88 protein [Bryobacterales bacterium]MEB2364103.1 glycoside hydrolase family 88 protein [Bryobacterales bacterium]